jgi:hypothetical protein
MEKDRRDPPASLRRGKASLPALLGVAWLALSVLPAAAQQTIGQFNATNGENQRHTGVQGDLRQQEMQQRRDVRQGTIGCQGAAAQAACLNQLKQQTQQQNLNLDARKLRERNQNWQTRQTIRQPFPDILKGTSVRPLP